MGTHGVWVGGAGYGIWERACGWEFRAVCRLSTCRPKRRFQWFGTLVRETTGLKLQCCVVVILGDTPLNVKVGSG